MFFFCICLSMFVIRKVECLDLEARVLHARTYLEYLIQVGRLLLRELKQLQSFRLILQTECMVKGCGVLTSLVLFLLLLTYINSIHPNTYFKQIKHTYPRQSWCNSCLDLFVCCQLHLLKMMINPVNHVQFELRLLKLLQWYCYLLSHEIHATYTIVNKFLILNGYCQPLLIKDF